MKHAYSFLAGVASISLTVFATRSLPGYMFLLGFGVCSLSVVLLCRAVGASQLARFFSHLSQPNSIRLASHWSSDAKRLPVTHQTAIPSSGSVRSASRQSGTVGDSRRTVSGSGNVPVRNRNHSRQSYASESRPRCNSSAAQNENSGSDVQSSNGNKDVLPQTQQDVLSALLNLKVPFSDAEQATRAAAKEHGGESFDTLFRTALNLLNAGKSRRAAA